MRLKVFLTLAALAVLLLGAARLSLGVGFSRYATAVELARLDSLATLLEGKRQARGTWAFLPPEGDLRPWLAGQDLPPLPQADRVSVLDAEGERIAGVDPPGQARRPLTVDGRTVGYLALQPAAEPAAVDREFLQGQQRNLLLLGAVALLCAAGAARFLTPPAGVPAESPETVEAQRRQWVADTSHELRTPVAVLRAQIEAMQDGVHPTTPENLDVLHEQVLALGRLVDDLHLLARGDAQAVTCRLQPLDLAGLVRDALQAQASRLDKAGLTMEARLPEELVLPGDRSRLRQVLANLLENSTRYTDRGGTIRVTLTRQGRHALLALEDSAPGVPPEAYDRLFDRFYRVDPSRTREQGGTGLGLSICRTLVEAHGGTIRALPSDLGGLRLEVRLNLA